MGGGVRAATLPLACCPSLLEAEKRESCDVECRNESLTMLHLDLRPLASPQSEMKSRFDEA